LPFLWLFIFTGEDPVWAAVLARPPFAGASDGGSASLAHLVDVFVQRQYPLWKEGAVQAWLLRACQAAAGTAEGGGPGPGGATAADWACAREEAFPPSSENEYDHLRVHDFSDAVARLPPEEMHGMNQQGRNGFVFRFEGMHDIGIVLLSPLQLNRKNAFLL
jgi:hypothetical protein